MLLQLYTPLALPSPVVPGTSLEHLPLLLERSTSQQTLSFFTVILSSPAVPALLAFSQN